MKQNISPSVLVLVESPFQLMSFYEYFYKHDLDVRDIFIVINHNSGISQKNSEILDSLLEFYDLTGFSFLRIDVPGSYRSVLRNRGVLSEVLDQLADFEFKQVLIGEFRSDLFLVISNSQRSAKTIYLDDGNAIFRLPKIRKNKNVRYWMKFFHAKINGLDTSYQKNVGYFSAFLSSNDISREDTLEKNSFTYLRKRSTESGIESASVTTLLIIGSPFGAAGVMSEDVEESLTRNLINQIKRQHSEKTIVYVPHRRDSEEKIRKIENLGVCVDQDLTPIEIKFSKYKCNHAVGFYSSCFTTLTTIYPELKIDAFNISVENLNPAWIDFVGGQYELYKSEKMINVVNDISC